MRQLLGTAQNEFFVKHDGELVPCLEIILMAEEKQHALDAAGNIRTSSVVELLRFTGSAQQILKLAESLKSYAEEAMKPDEQRKEGA